MNLSAVPASFAPPMLAAMRMPLETLLFLGGAAVICITAFTFSNWRLGVKVAFVMVLFEGAIRKWVLPGMQELAYFAKDMFLIGAYMRFFFAPDSDIRSFKTSALGGAIALACALLAFSALNPNVGSPVLAIYGLKIYLFYIPLAFMMPYLFRTKEEMMNNLFWYAALALPICLLGVAQFAAPGYSALNIQAQGSEGIDMGWGGDARIRVTGTFSFITGHTTFVMVFFALFIALLLNNLQKWRWMFLAAVLPMIIANGLMSGSRSSVVGFAAIVVIFGAVSLYQRMGTGNNNVIFILSGLGVAAVLAIFIFFGEARDQWMKRFSSGGMEDVTYRMLGMQGKSIEYAFREGGMFGYGIGMTHPAIERLRNVLGVKSPSRWAPTYDTELGQVLVELGVVGWAAWYLMRIAMLLQSWTLFTRTPPGEIKPIMLAAIIIQLSHLVLSVVFNHTANFLVFACYGICLIPSLHPTIRRTTAPAPRGSLPSPPPVAIPPRGRGERPVLPNFRGTRG